MKIHVLIKAIFDAFGLRLIFASYNDLLPETPGIYIGQRIQEIPTWKQRSGGKSERMSYLYLQFGKYYVFHVEIYVNVVAPFVNS